MRVVIVGITGRVGRLVAHDLVARGDDVRGIVRRARQRAELAEAGIPSVIGDLAETDVDGFELAIADAEVVVFAAGSNGGAAEVTRAIDVEALARLTDAVARTGARLLLVSVLPESWRERALTGDEEFYFAAKKRAEAALVRSGVDWVIVRPSLLTDDPATGAVSVSPAELHDEVSRADVAAVVAELVHAPEISRRILEMNRGTTTVAAAVAALLS